MSRAELTSRLLGPPVTGYRALFWAMLAVSLPTLLRLGLDDFVTGVAITPYIPFALLSAIFLSWKSAAGAAVASALIADAVFIGPRFQLLEGPSDFWAVTFFLVASAMFILFVHFVRISLNEMHRAKIASDQASRVVFSLERGEAWAGWQGHASRVHLGPEDEVAEMMEDFLAQLELAERLNNPRP